MQDRTVSQQIDDLMASLNRDDLESFRKALNVLIDAEGGGIDVEMYSIQDKENVDYIKLLNLIEVVLRSEKLGFIEVLVEQGIGKDFIFRHFSGQFDLHDTMLSMTNELLGLHVPLYWYIASFASPATIDFCRRYNVHPEVKFAIAYSVFVSTAELNQNPESVAAVLKDCNLFEYVKGAALLPFFTLARNPNPEVLKHIISTYRLSKEDVNFRHNNGMTLLFTLIRQYTTVYSTIKAKHIAYLLEAGAETVMNGVRVVDFLPTEAQIEKHCPSITEQQKAEYFQIRNMLNPAPTLALMPISSSLPVKKINKSKRKKFFFEEEKAAEVTKIEVENNIPAKAIKKQKSTRTVSNQQPTSSRRLFGSCIESNKDFFARVFQEQFPKGFKK